MTGEQLPLVLPRPSRSPARSSPNGSPRGRWCGRFVRYPGWKELDVWRASLRVRL